MDGKNVDTVLMELEYVFIDLFMSIFNNIPIAVWVAC